MTYFTKLDTVSLNFYDAFQTRMIQVKEDTNGIVSVEGAILMASLAALAFGLFNYDATTGYTGATPHTGHGAVINLALDFIGDKIAVLS